MPLSHRALVGRTSQGKMAREGGKVPQKQARRARHCLTEAELICVGREIGRKLERLTPKRRYGANDSINVNLRAYKL